MNKEWIFFDVGGTLTDESFFTQWRAKNNLEIAQKYLPDLIEKDVWNVWERASSMKGGLDDNILSILLDDTHKTQEAIQELNDRKSKAPSYTDTQIIRPEARTVVKALSAKYKLGLIANQSQAINLKLEEAGVLQYFSYKNVSGHVGYTKPDPEYFKAVFKESGAKPATSVMVDDNIERGLLPAKSFGMETVWFKVREREIPEQGVDKVITSLSELIDLFL